MKRLIFKKENLSQFPIPEEGYMSLGVSEDGTFKTINDFGTISSIGGEVELKTLNDISLSGTGNIDLYGDKRYTLIKSNSSKEFYDNLSQVRSNWADGDVLHQFADETISWSLSASDSMFVLPSIKWNGNGFKITMQDFTSANTVGFLITSKTVDIFDLNFDVNINANNTFFIRCSGTGVLNLSNVKGVQTNATGFGTTTYMLQTQNTGIINGDNNTVFSSVSNVVISGGSATCNAYIGTSTSFVNGITFNNFRFAEIVRGRNLVLNVSRLFSSCIIQQSRFLQVSSVTGTNNAIEGVSSGTFTFEQCEIVFNTPNDILAGTFTTVDYFECNVKNLQACTGGFYNLINSTMTWIGSCNTISATVNVVNSYITSSGARDQIRINSGGLTVRNSTLIHNDATANNTNILWLPNITIDIQDSCLINLNSGYNLRGSGVNSGWSNTYFNKNEIAFNGIDGYTDQQLRDSNKYRLTHNQDFTGNIGIGRVSSYPDMTTVERNTLTNVRRGYEINNTTTNHIERYDGSTFKEILELFKYTTVQMNGIASPISDMLIFNTDLKAIFRYDLSTTTWVALSSGYGIIGVYSGSGNGTPTFFADLQSALETCKASGGYFTVKLYSNITITSAINIRYTGSGIGNAYLFRNLTIDLNGFSITNAQTDNSHALVFIFSDVASIYQEAKLVNGNIIRTNGTGTHFGVYAGGYGTVQMNKMYIFNQNSRAIQFELANSTNVQARKTCDFGGSTFISQNNFAVVVENFTTQHLKNFNAITHSSGHGAVACFFGEVSDFYAENVSTTYAVNLTAKASNFFAKANQGTALVVSANAEVYNGRAESTTGYAIFAELFNGIMDGFTAKTGNNYALYFTGDAEISNGKCINNSSLATYFANNFKSIHNIEGINRGSGNGAFISNSNSGSRAEATFCKAVSIGGIGALIDASTGANRIVNVDNCTFVSHWDNAGGHGVRVQSTTAGTINITNSHIKVRNSGANAINATSAVTVNSRYCTHNDVATTPINANVTIVNSGVIS